MDNRYLYKAKRKDNGEWVEGIPIKTHIGLFICFEENPHYCSQYGYMEIDEIIIADENTLCQCTGLTDKNDELIWENDIVKFEDTGEEGYECKEGFDYINRAKVVWNKGRFELDSFLSNNSGTLELMNSSPEEFYDMFEEYAEVIGNIFDNPSLLEP